MRKETVEIYSDATNAAVMRHPSRKFPGVLLQGDTLSGMLRSAEALCRDLQNGSTGLEEANDLREQFSDLLQHYKSVLKSHGLPLPFSE